MAPNSYQYSHFTAFLHERISLATQVWGQSKCILAFRFCIFLLMRLKIKLENSAVNTELPHKAALSTRKCVIQSHSNSSASLVFFIDNFIFYRKLKLFSWNCFTQTVYFLKLSFIYFRLELFSLLFKSTACEWTGARETELLVSAQKYFCDSHSPLRSRYPWLPAPRSAHAPSIQP